MNFMRNSINIIFYYFESQIFKILDVDYLGVLGVDYLDILVVDDVFVYQDII